MRPLSGRLLPTVGSNAQLLRPLLLKAGVFVGGLQCGCNCLQSHQLVGVPEMLRKTFEAEIALILYGMRDPLNLIGIMPA